MDILRYAELGSTNDEALRLAATGAAHGTVVVARQQTAGRGRQGRRWVSPPGNLHASFLLRTDAFRRFAPAHAAQPGFAAALAVAEALDPHAAGSRLKWPNDVLLHGAKVAGILTELASTALVVGIGVNIAHAPPDMPYPVTCLAQHGASLTVDRLLDGLAARFAARLAEWDAHGFDPIRAAWTARGPAPGQPLTIRTAGPALHGRFHGLDRDGALLLDAAAGLHRIVAGDVT